MTTGSKTTEFWLGLLGAILGVVVSLGYLTPEQATGLQGSADQIAGAIISALSILGYQVSRGLAKKDMN
jgi:hypothetical protein